MNEIDEANNRFINPNLKDGYVLLKDTVRNEAAKWGQF